MSRGNGLRTVYFEHPGGDFPLTLAPVYWHITAVKAMPAAVVLPPIDGRVGMQVAVAIETEDAKYKVEVKGAKGETVKHYNWLYCEASFIWISDGTAWVPLP